ncbi:putative glycolipid-binding domain-containing protein [Vogesella sp. LIG4]|uniref:putative glycolipid-binding domain-containing protein n=1 Tax=Vogesella sp. LIG4 TaxID=1192162 RepID=UPI00081FE7F2|nr:putative glycolipid-binding domain-containing protein [Vogesella sp. LIG4]SCK23215.1 hypothetical protein PSELUDRAFT_2701 [Vogesella sp. LIG4]
MLPPVASWQRTDAPGLETVSLTAGEQLAFSASGHLLHPAAQPVCLSYRLQVGRTGLVDNAEFTLHAPGPRTLNLLRNVAGRWHADGVAMPAFDSCSELDLQCGGLTNALPIRRLQLAPGDSAQLQVLFVRLPQLTLEICPQRYTRLADDAQGHARYRYQSPGFSAEISVDCHGLTLCYSDFLQRLAADSKPEQHA